MIPGTLGVVYGRRGSGKSTLLTLLLDHPTEDVWLSSEESTALVAIRNKRLGVSPEIEEVKSVEQLQVALDRRALIPTRRLVFDSASAIGTAREGLQAVYMLSQFALEHSVVVIVVLQVTQAGTAAGMSETQHATDWIGQAGILNGRRFFGLDKNRMGTLVTVPWRFDTYGRVVSVVDTDGLYSVEGDEGSFILQKFPIGPARWADPWVQASKSFRGLTAMRRMRGVATSAVWAPHDPDLFVAPEDTVERRKFAELAGLRWLDAHELAAELDLADPLDQDPGEGEMP
jgi:hypothetical protein